MKLHIAERPIERIGIASESKFAVKGTGKAFRILSSNLYRDKILAIVREISCNAYDAHVAKGTPLRPFEVHLPNALEPYFSVRDFGPGLTHDDVLTVYTTYFESTKTDSNDFIGALGLGSKSPFSYVDSYTVLSRQKGEKRTYTLFIDETDCPVVTLIGSPSATEEEDGLEVIIPVDKSQDFHEFRRRAEQVYAVFKTPPKVTGSSEFKISEREIALGGDGFRIYKDGGCRAIMGNVAYPISYFSLNASDQKVRDLTSLNIDIDFPMGSLDFTAGREELSYDQKTTIPAIIRRCNDVYEDVVALATVEVAKAPSEYEARRIHRNLRSVMYSLRNITMSWRGLPIVDSEMMFDLSDLKTVSVQHVEKRAKGVRVTNVLDMRKVRFAAQDHLRVFQLDGSPHDGMRRIRDHLKHYESAEVVRASEPEELAAAIARLVDRGIPLTLASSLPKPTPLPRTPVSAKKWTASGISNASVSTRFTVPAEVDINSGGKFILMKSGKPTALRDNDDFALMINAARVNNLIQDKDPIYVIPYSISKAFVDDPGWTEWVTDLRSRVDSLFANPEVIEKVRRANGFITHFGRNNWGFHQEMNVYKKVASCLPKDHHLHHLVSTIESSKKVADNNGNLSDLAVAFGIKVPALELKDDLDVMWRSFTTDYPLVRALVEKCRGGAIHEAEVAKYIRLVEHGRATAFDFGLVNVA